MDYENLEDAAATENSAILEQAVGLEDRAILCEYESERTKAVADITPVEEARLAALEEQAKAARLEADAFLKEALDRGLLTEEGIEERRKATLTRVLEAVEANHVAAKAVRDVRKKANLPVADRDNTLEELDLSWEVAANKLRGLGKKRPPKKK